MGTVMAGCVEKCDEDAGTGDVETREPRSVGTWGRGDAFLPFVQLFIIFQKSPRLLIVTVLYPGFMFLVCAM